MCAFYFPQITDILDCRIEAVLEDISSTCLCELPEDDSITVEEFLKRTEETCSAVIVALSRFEIYVHNLYSSNLVLRYCRTHVIG
jgi:dynein heavy chain